MKGKIENKQEKPWYVRLSQYLNARHKRISIIMILIAVLGYILGSAISYDVLSSKPMKPYEETYDVEFKNFVNEKLENIAEEVIHKENGIDHEMLRNLVPRYLVEYQGQTLVLNYSLNKEQTISDYTLETGKEPIFSYSNSEQEFNMRVEISGDFEIISKQSTLEVSQTREEYEHLYPRRIWVNAFLLYGFQIEMAILVFYLVILLPTIFIQIHADSWERKHEKAVDRR